jgi:DNA-binding Lrp family transcriptional regulator
MKLTEIDSDILNIRDYDARITKPSSEFSRICP